MKRSELYAQIWTEPARTLAAKVGMSDRGLSKLCDRFAIPTPPRGYWARVASGVQIPRTPLPRPADDFEIKALAMFDGHGVRRWEATKKSPLALFVGRVSDFDDGVMPANSHLQVEDSSGAVVAAKDDLSPEDATSCQLDGEPPDARCSDGEAPRAVDASPFACGLFSDGRLVLEVGSEVLTLSQDQAYQLISYLDRFAGPVHRGPGLAAATPAAT